MQVLGERGEESEREGKDHNKPAETRIITPIRSAWLNDDSSTLPIAARSAAEAAAGLAFTAGAVFNKKKWIGSCLAFGVVRLIQLQTRV